ncbi:hypothetical protein [Taibaiella chishuiensis]|uniref:Uncharacterized protein n=1 Tax=Taibaiella chishuiensis TaxID=1434707 RepID=A0A2P8D313_9BACT|nr:hypothetical protein [Taibaiella chishuiensis]PSK91611.1 hypothetical protein B0I18_105196 [Taibaiella chishuiensis]
MKKLFLSLCLVVSAAMAQANSLTVQNLLSVPITLSFWGFNPDGSVFTTPPITFTPGPHPFADPTLLPGVTGAWTTGRVVSGFGICNPYDLAIGSPNAGGPSSHQAVGTLNMCNNNIPFDMYWNEPNMAPYNAVLLIF